MGTLIVKNVKHFLVFSLKLVLMGEKYFVPPPASHVPLLSAIKNYMKILCGKFLKFNSSAQTRRRNNTRCMKTKLMTLYTGLRQLLLET